MRRISVIAIAVCFLLFVFGCNPRNNLPAELVPTVDDETTLTVLGKKGDLTDSVYMNRIFELYEKKTGKKIKQLTVENGEFEDTAKRMFEQNKIPDMILHFNDTDLLPLDIDKNFYDFKDASWVSDLTDSARECSLGDNGRVLGLPFWENSVSGCYYNKTLFGRNFHSAASQAEFNIICDTLVKMNIVPLFWAGKGCNWMFQFGLDPVFADAPDGPNLLAKLNSGEIKYKDIPAVKNMVEWFEAAAKKGWFNADHADKGWDDIPDEMGNGEAAMIFCWDTWFSSNLPDSKNKSNGGPYKYTMKDFALMPVFMGTTENGTYEGGNMNILMVNKNGKKLQLALDFISFCATPENYNIAFDGVPTVKNFKGQTTNTEAPMVTAVAESVQKYRRVSTAWTKILGYRPDDMGNGISMLFKKEISASDCVKLLDELRLSVINGTAK